MAGEKENANNDTHTTNVPSRPGIREGQGVLEVERGTETPTNLQWA